LQNHHFIFFLRPWRTRATGGGGGGPGGSKRRRLGHPGAQPCWGIERGDREGLEDVLTTGGDQRGWPDFCGGGRRWGIGGGRSPGTGGTPVLPSRRAGAAEVQLDLAKLLVTAVSLAGLHGRRMEDGRRRCFSVLANCVARRRRRAWRARARRSFGRRSYIGHRARGGAGVHGMDAKGKAAAGASRVLHEHWGSWGSGPRWAFAGGLVAGPAGWDAGLERTGLRPAETKLG
jgi:hypothetical protein